MVIFFSSAQSVYFNQFFCPHHIWTFSDFGPYQITYWKNTLYIDTELAGHAHKLDVKLQSLCGGDFSLFAVRMLAKPDHLGVNWPTHCAIKDVVHFFTLKFECHNRYNKLLLCNSENSDIAW